MDRRPFAASFPNAGNSNGTGAPSPRLGGENWEGLRLLFLLSSGGISFHRSLSTEEMSEDRVSVLFAERIDVIASYKRKRERESLHWNRPLHLRVAWNSSTRGSVAPFTR